MEKRKPSQYIWFVLASIALHLFFFFGFIFLNEFLFFSELFKRLDHEIIDKTDDLTAQIELIDIKENQKQVVEQDDSINKEEPAEADYLSKDDQSVKEQTKASISGAFKNSRPSQARPESVQSSPTVTAKKMVTERPPFKSASPLGLAGLAPSNDLEEIIQRQEAYQKQQQQTPLSQASTQSPLATPSMTDDYLEDVKQGDFTRLNTRRFEHYSFYSRVKGQLRSHWNPLIRQEVYFIYSTKRSLASLNKKRTTLRVTLDKNGYLTKVELLTTSGNEKIDMAAIQAFRTAAPFPNPPIELLEKDGHLRLFWDFVLET